MANVQLVNKIISVVCYCISDYKLLEYVEHYYLYCKKQMCFIAANKGNLRNLILVESHFI